MILQRRVTYLNQTGILESKTTKIIYTWWLLGIIPLIRIEEDFDAAMRRGLE